MVVPSILVIAFEQAYVVHKRKVANFCCIRFDRGHRLNSTTYRSNAMRLSMWFIAGCLLIFNLAMNILVVRGDLDFHLDKQQRFTTKSLITNPQMGDLVEFVLLVIFTLYFGVSLWKYGKNFSMSVSAMPCNNWMYMLAGSILLFALNLLPDTITPFT